MKHLFILNEATLLRVVIYIALGRRPLLLFTDPLVRVFAGPLGRISGWLVDRGLVETLADLSPDLPWIPRFPLEKNMTYGALHAIEDDLHTTLIPKELESRLSENAYPMHKVVSDYVEKIKDLFVLSRWMESNFRAGPWVLHGAPKLLDLMFLLSSGLRPAFVRRRGLAPPRLINTLNTVSLAAAGLAWLASRVRLAPVRIETFRLASDRVSPIDAYLHRQVIDDPSELLIVDRNREMADQFRSENGSFRTCLKEDARLSPPALLRVAWPMIVALAHKWWMLGRSDPELFARYAIVPVKRAMFAAFFERFRPRFFWGRDDYSIDHIIRNQELRKIGGVSLGINHGLPINTSAAAWREVDFDIYYAYGSYLHEHFNKKTWPRHTVVKPVGTQQMRPEYRARLADPRPKDIAFFPIVLGRFEETIREAFKVADHFQDRRFYVKMKPNRHPHYVEAYKNLMRQAPRNVVAYTDVDPYKLLLSVSYGICFTTLVAEALQFKVMTFTLDTDPDIKMLYYRNFPGLTVPDGETIIRRIEAIEDGRETYDFEQYDELVRIDGPEIYNVIRQDIGLSAIGPTQSVTAPSRSTG